MKTTIKLLLLSTLLLALSPAIAQMEELPKSDSAGVTGGAVIGAVTIDGKNYQQFALRTDIPIGKFGFGLDIQLLFDENGQIRKEEWDQWQDYIDKVYYIRYGKKDDPFYIRLGGLDYTYLGYANIVNGYSNMVQYPSRRRYGGELSFWIPAERYKGMPIAGGEFFFNDIKEVFVEDPRKPAMLVGSRIFYRPLRFLEFGISAAADLNEYNAFEDRDGDGIPNLIDLYPKNKLLATEMDNISIDQWNHLLNDPYWGATRAEAYQKLLSLGLVPADTMRMADLFNLNNQTSKMYAYSFDMGIPIARKENFKFDIYSHITQLRGQDRTYGWGVALPGVRMILGTSNVQNFLTFKAEYRKSSKEFLFGYFNNTYELERAQFVGRDSVITKQQRLLSIQQELNGIFASVELNMFGYIVGYGGYQDLIGKDKVHMRSLHGEIRMGETLKKMLSFADLKGYYIQNNVQDFRQWKTPSTLVGINVGYNYKGAIVGIDYRWTFQDLNGDGIIKGSAETFKTISFRTAVSF